MIKYRKTDKWIDNSKTDWNSVDYYVIDNGVVCYTYYGKDKLNHSVYSISEFELFIKEGKIAPDDVFSKEFLFEEI